MSRSSFAAFQEASRFAADESAVSAIEFALLLPFIVLLLAGMVDVNEGLTVRRKLRQISSSISDLVAQRGSITKDNANNFLAGAATILEPYDGINLSIVLTVANVTDEGQTVAWSLAYQGAKEAAGAASANPAPDDLAETGVQMVGVTVDYSFETIFSSYLAGIYGRTGYSMHDEMHERPRIGDTITLD